MKTAKFVSPIVFLALLISSGGAQDSLNISLVGQIGYWSGPTKVIQREGYAYFPNSEALKIVNLSDPENPLEVGNFNPEYSIYDADVQGDYAYIVAGPEALHVVDISDPSAPQEVGSWGNGWLQLVEVSGDYAYVEYAIPGVIGGIYVLDISQPSQPFQIADIGWAFAWPGSVVSILANTDHLYVGDAMNGLVTINVENPSAPVVCGAYFLPELWGLPMVAESNYLYASYTGLVMDFPSLQIFDISNPDNPTLAGEYRQFGNFRDMIWLDGLLYGTQWDSLRILDVTDPSQVTQIGGMNLGDSRGLSVEDSLAVVARYWEGITTLDVSNPLAPEPVGNLDRIGSVNVVEVSGNYAFVADYYKGVRIIDISDPIHPADTVLFPLGPYNDGCDYMVLRDNTVYVTANPYFYVLEISNPLEPQIVGSCSWEITYPFQVDGDYVYANGIEDFALKVVDISDPTQPEVVAGCLPEYVPVRDMALSGDLLWLATEYSGLYLVNVSDPLNPIVTGQYIPGGNITLVEATDSILYVADNIAHELLILDVSDPDNPALVSTYGDSLFLENIIVSGSHLFLAESVSGLHILDIVNPSTPIETGYYNTQGLSADVEVVGNSAYVADAYDFLVLDCSAALPVPPERVPILPSQFKFYPPHPNPFNPTTTLSFTLPVPGMVTLEVFDVNGRNVGAQGYAPTLGGGNIPALQYFPAGAHHILFDGSDLPSGIYLARLKAGEWLQVQKLVLLK